MRSQQKISLQAQEIIVWSEVVSQTMVQEVWFVHGEPELYKK